MEENKGVGLRDGYEFWDFVTIAIAKSNFRIGADGAGFQPLGLSGAVSNWIMKAVHFHCCARRMAGWPGSGQARLQLIEGFVTAACPLSFPAGLALEPGQTLSFGSEIQSFKYASVKKIQQLEGKLL